MSTAFPFINLKKLKVQFDWKLLLFLILFLDVKLAVKIVAILLIYVLQADFHFGFSLKNSRLPLFYPLIIVTAIVGALINANPSVHNYWPAFITGLAFWLLCLLAIHQIKLSVESNDTVTIHKTLLIFFVINAAVSFLNIGLIIFKTHEINPYIYQGENQKYFLNTGDYIKGLTFDTSTTNAVINAFGVIYFLFRKNALMMLLCMTTLLLTMSNTLNILLMAILVLLFIFNTSREQKSLIAVSIFLLVLFMTKISPQNSSYVVDSVHNLLHIRDKKVQPQPQSALSHLPIKNRPDSTLTAEEKREKIAQLYIDSINHAAYLNYAEHHIQYKATVSVPAKPFIQPIVNETGRIIKPEADINSAPYQSLTTTPAEELPLLSFIAQHKNELPLSGQPFHWSATPGKAIAAKQTVAFYKTHPFKIFTGDGMGNFSSKLAFKTTGLNINGSYPEKHVYINHDFLTNHLDLYLNSFSKAAGYHSLTNSPFSVYDQIAAEYGLAGMIFFMAFYLWFFVKKARSLTYGLPILLLLLPVLAIDYWFEQLSIIILFELLLLLDIKESAAKSQLQYEHR